MISIYRQLNLLFLNLPLIPILLALIFPDLLTPVLVPVAGVYLVSLTRAICSY